MEQAWLYFSGMVLIAASIALAAWCFYLINKGKQLIDTKQLNDKRIAPLQLQAYERLVLFLERTDLNNLVMRLNQAGMNSQLLHVELLKNIRKEYEHNLVQQLYVSEGVWQLITIAREKNIQTINMASDKVAKDDSSVMLARQIISAIETPEKQPNRIALKALKNEKRSRFGV
jgi:ribonuclease HIII